MEAATHLRNAVAKRDWLACAKTDKMVAFTPSFLHYHGLRSNVSGLYCRESHEGGGSSGTFDTVSMPLVIPRPSWQHNQKYDRGASNRALNIDSPKYRQNSSRVSTHSLHTRVHIILQLATILSLQSLGL